MAPQVDEKSKLRRGRVFGAVLGDEGGARTWNFWSDLATSINQKMHSEIDAIFNVEL